MIDKRQFWKVPTTAIFGSVVGAVLLFVLGSAYEPISRGSYAELIYLPMMLLLGFVLGLPAALEALPWVLGGTVLSFWPLCRYFRVSTTRNHLIILIWGALLGGVLGLYAIGTKDEGGGRGPVGPWTGALYGVVTAAFGRALMRQESEGE